MPSAFTGDEAQILLRSGLAPIGIGADRYSTARILLESFQIPASCFLTMASNTRGCVASSTSLSSTDWIPSVEDELVPWEGFANHSRPWREPTRLLLHEWKVNSVSGP